MTRLIITTAIIGLIAVGCQDETGTPAADRPVAPEGYNLVWQDEFNAEQINTDNWSFETGDGTDYGLPAGWGNNELQLYTDQPDNAAITKDGDLSVLQLTAHQTSDGGYSSSKVVTNEKVSVRFGRVEVKAKLPQGQGIWPALWMLGDNRPEIDWPGCGEIDIMELLGHEPNKVYATVHYVADGNSKGETQGSYTLPSGTFSDDYHVFTLDWTPEEMLFYVDDELIHQVTIDDDMKEFLRSFYLIANVAVGGFWPGYPDESTNFPQSMYIDYIRIYEKDGFEAPEAPILDVSEETFGQFVADTVALSAIKDGFTAFESAEIISYGGGGEPIVSVSELSVNGDYSLSLNYPGTTWGGAYVQLDQSVDASSFSTLSFSISAPDSFTDGEVKLETSTTNAAIFLVNYTGLEAGNGFVTYEIPLADFTGLDLSALRIPFALWNPVDSGGAYVNGEFLIDNIHLVE